MGSVTVLKMDENVMGTDKKLVATEMRNGINRLRNRTLNKMNLKAEADEQQTSLATKNGFSVLLPRVLPPNPGA